MFGSYIDRSVVAPTKQVASEVIGLMAFASIGILVAAATTVMIVARRITDNKR